MAAVTLGDLMNPLTKIEQYTGETSQKLDKVITLLGKTKADGGGGKGKKSDPQAAETLSALGVGTLSMAKGLMAFALVPKKVGKKFIDFTKGILDVLDMYGTEDAKRGAETLAILGDSMWSFAKKLALASLLLIPSLLLAPLTIFTVGMFGLLFWTLGKFEKQIDRGSEVLMWMGISLILFGIGLGLFALSSMIVLSQPKVLLAMVASLVLIPAAVALAGVYSGYIEKGAFSLAIIGISLAIFGIGFGLFALVSAAVTWEHIGIMLGILVGVSVALALVGALASFIIPGAIALIIMGTGLILFGVGIGLFRLATWGMTPEDILVMSGTILGIGLAIAPLGLLMVPIALGAAAMIIAGAALITLGIGLLLFSGGWLVADKVGLWNPSATDPDITNFEASLDAIAAGLSINPFTVIGIYLGAPALIIGGTALILLGVGLIAFAGGYALTKGVGLWDKSTTDPKVLQFEAVMDSIAAGLSIGPFTAIGILLGAPMLMLGGIALLVLGGGLAVFSLGYDMGKASGLWDKSTLNPKIMQFESVMDNIAAGMSINPFTAAGIYLGAPALILAGAALASIAPGIDAFGALWKQKQVKNLFAKRNDFIVTSWFSPDRNGSNFEYMMLGLAQAFDLPKLTIASMYLSAPALIMAGKALQQIAEGISMFQKIIDDTAGGNLDVITENITKVITTVSGAFGAIGAGSKGGMLDKIGSFFGKTDIPGTDQYSAEDVAAGIESTAGMGEILVNVAKGVAAFAAMRYTDANGKVHVIDAAVQEKAVKNIGQVISTVGQAFGAIGAGSKGGLLSFLGDMVGVKVPGSDQYSPSDIAAGVEATTGMGEILVNVAKGVVAFADMKFTDAEGKSITIPEADLMPGGKIIKNIGNVLTATASVFGKIGASSDGGYFSDPSGTGFTSDQVREGVDAVQGIGGILTGVANAVNAFAKEGVPDVKVIEQFVISLVTTMGRFGALPEESKVLVESGIDMVTGLFDSLAKAADIEDPLKNVAKQFGVMKKAINGMKIDKVEKLHGLMTSITQLQGTEGASQMEAVVASIEKLNTSLQPKETPAAAATTAATTTATGAPTDSNEAILQELKALRGAISGLQGTMANLPDDISQIKLKVNVD